MAVFSNWFPAPFVDPKDGVKYNNTEQYMMRYKALTFNDRGSADAIMATDDPALQKSIGRQVKGYDDDVWTKRSQDVVYEGNLLKYTQNPRLLKILKDTGDAILVEASPTDTRWGIGLKADSPKARDMRQWRGENWLGIAIMRVWDTVYAKNL